MLWVDAKGYLPVVAKARPPAAELSSFAAMRRIKPAPTASAAAPTAVSEPIPNRKPTARAHPKFAQCSTGDGLSSPRSAARPRLIHSSTRPQQSPTSGQRWTSGGLLGSSMPTRLLPSCVSLSAQLAHAAPCPSPHSKMHSFLPGQPPQLTSQRRPPPLVVRQHSRQRRTQSHCRPASQFLPSPQRPTSHGSSLRRCQASCSRWSSTRRATAHSVHDAVTCAPGEVVDMTWSCSVRTGIGFRRGASMPTPALIDLEALNDLDLRETWSRLACALLAQ